MLLNPWRVRLLRLLSVLALALSIIGIVIVPNPLTSPPSESQVESAAIPHTDVNPLGANFFLDREVEFWKQEQTLKMAREAGIGWVKMLFSWEGIEPQKGHFWDDKSKKSTWEKFDKIVQLCEKYGLRIIARLDRPPDWTRFDNTYKTAPPDDFEDYGDFVYAVVSRYRGRIQHYQIWNEPNIWPEWGDRDVNPAGYVELLKVAYQRAKQADPNALILSAPLAQTLEKGPRNLNEIDYLKGMYQAGAKDYFDIMLANAYGFDRPPTDLPNPTRLNFARIKLLRQAMVESGDTNKSVWLNEFGWNASPEDFPEDKLFWRRVSEQEQAEYTAQGIKIAREWGWVGVINIWYFRQVGDIPVTQSDYYFRVIDVDFTPRLVYYKLKEISRSLEVALPGLHQEMSPAVKARGNWSPILQAGAYGDGLIASSTPGDTLTLTFWGTEVALFYSGDQISGRLYVIVDGKDPGLPSREQNGRSYVDLYVAGRIGITQLHQVLVSGLSPGQHTIKLTVAEKSNPQSGGHLCAIDAFEVKNIPSFLPFYVFCGLFALGVAVLVSSFLIRRSQ